VDLDLAQVRAFVAVVDHGHFGRAAQELALSQQALSKRVARLESRLGRLLERGRGGVGLTPAGERFLPSARQVLEVADHAVAEARQAPGPPLRVDVWSEIQSPARAMRDLARAHPDLVIELSMRRDLVEALAAVHRHELDVAFGNVANLHRPLSPELTAELVMTDPIAVLVNARSALAEREHVTPADLAREGLWFPMAGSSQELRAFTEEYAESIGATLVSAGSNVGIEAVVDRVATDPTVVAPVAATWPLTGRADVRVVPLRPAPHFPWYAVWRTTSAHPSLPRILRALRAERPSRVTRHGSWLPKGVEVPGNEGVEAGRVRTARPPPTIRCGR
jgi:DNA-binding transcriptional LysR family regulator